MSGLTDYQQRRLDLADMLRAVLHVARRYSDEGRQREIRELLGRLAAGRFRLAVAGQFSRGKTTLMNALLGDTFLPAGALPVTAVVTTVRYGTRARALIRSRAGGLPVEVPVAEAARFIEQASADRARMRVASVEIEVPAELLRLGFEFIDTPGVGSAIAANTATMRFLPQADAIVFVTSFDSALSQAEADFIAAASLQAGHIFLVINKRDLVGEPDITAVTGYVQSWARENLPGSRHHVFGLSALAELHAAIGSDDGRLADSGFEPFRAELIRFLATQQGMTALRAVATAAAGLVRRQAAELRAGLRADQDNAGRPGVAEAFDERVGALGARIDAMAEGIAGRLSAAVPRLLAERCADWKAELRNRLTDAASPARMTGEPGAQSEPAGWDAVPVRQAAAEWLEHTAAGMQEAIIELAGDRISDLLHAARSPRALGAVVSGQAPYPAPPAGWLAGQVPDLLIPAVEWKIPGPPSGRQHRRGRRGAAAQGQPDEGSVATAIESFVDQARAGLEMAASRWAVQLGEQAMRDMTTEARQFRRYLRTRPRAEDLEILTDLGRRLTEYLDSQPLETAAGEGALAPMPGTRPPAPAASRPRCEICGVLEDELTDFLIHRQFQLATSEADQARYARAGGFCSLHTWRFASMSSPVGISAGYAALTRKVADQLDAASQAGTAAGSVAHQLDSLVAATGCPACAALARREARAATQLAAAADGSGAPVLCLRHLALVLHAGPPPAAGAAMIRGAAAALRRAAEGMRSYALKREALRQSLATDDEEQAHSDALRLLAGAPALAQPWEPG